MSKFKIGDYIEVIKVYSTNIDHEIKKGMRGHILDDEDDIPNVKFDGYNSEEKLGCYSMAEEQLKLVKGE